MSEFIESLTLRSDYTSEVEKLRVELKPTVDRGGSQCCKSGFCCWRAPAELTPTDLTRLADYKGLSPTEFFREFCIVDTHPRSGGLIVRLRRKHQAGGEMTDWRETFSVASPCVFLTADSLCGVHDAKPECCSHYKCWSEDDSQLVYDRIVVWDTDALVSLGWNGVNPDGEE